MSEPFLGEIKIVGFNFAPRGWAFCDGQILPINTNQSLYSLLGTMYGGDGRTTFALPDLRGRAPIHRGDYNSQGQMSGAETITLTASEIPEHNHTMQGVTEYGDSSTLSNGFLAQVAPTNLMYGEAKADTMVTLAAATISSVGGSQSHNNMQPSQVLSFCIALQGLFPSRN